MSTEEQTGTHPAEVSGPLFKIFFPQVHYSYCFALEERELHNLRMRRLYLNALFLIQASHGSKFCLSVF
jgi:hypothetical protein